MLPRLKPNLTMNKLPIIAVLLALASGLKLPAAETAPAPAPGTEARGVWMHPALQFSTDPVVGKQQIHNAVRRLADANFNLILPWVLSEHIVALTDTNDQAAVPHAKWDALGELVLAARECGIRVHLWYSFTHYKSPQSPEFNPRHGGNPAWAAWQIDNRRSGEANAMTDVCPLHPAARAWELKAIERLLDRYPGVGIHIEEPGFGYFGNCVCDLCRKTFRELYGFEETDAINGPQAEDLKCLGTTEFIRQLRARLDQRSPKPALSVNGGSSWRVDRTLGRDWRRWAQLHWLDYYASQIYREDLGDFVSSTQTVMTDLENDCPVFVGIGVKWSGGASSLPMVLQQIDAARKRGAKGLLFFSASALTDEHYAALKAGPFKNPAGFPEVERLTPSLEK
jgi:uncharacterized lipoprotein YddW (UPF0748 family)